MKKKTVIATIILLLIIVPLIIYSKNKLTNSTKVEPIDSDGWVGEIISDIKGYDMYGEDVNELLDNSLMYLAYVKDAYEKSDGTNLKSFKLSDESQIYLENVENIDTSYMFGDDDSMTHALMKLKIQEIILKINISINKRELLMIDSNKDNMKNWFIEIRELLLEAKDFYTYGTYLY